MDRACEQHLNQWLAEIESPAPDPMRTAQVARQLAACLATSQSIQRLILALRDEADDPLDCESCQERLPDFIYAQLDAPDELQQPRNQEVRRHLAFCQHCASAYADVAEWLAESQADAIPVADSYPTFDLSLAVQATPATSPVAASASAWSTDAVQRALAEGKEWAIDALNGVYLILARGIQSQPSAAWALKSAEPNQMLAQTVLGEDEVQGWELEAAAIADATDSDSCRIEVAIYKLNDPSTSLADRAVTLRYGELMQTKNTDANGVVLFEDIPNAALAQCVVRVALPAAAQ